MMIVKILSGVAKLCTLNLFERGRNIIRGMERNSNLFRTVLTLAGGAGGALIVNYALPGVINYHFSMFGMQFPPKGASSFIDVYIGIIVGGGFLDFTASLILAAYYRCRYHEKRELFRPLTSSELEALYTQLTNDPLFAQARNVLDGQNNKMEYLQGVCDKIKQTTKNYKTGKEKNGRDHIDDDWLLFRTAKLDKLPSEHWIKKEFNAALSGRSASSLSLDLEQKLSVLWEERSSSPRSLTVVVDDKKERKDSSDNSSVQQEDQTVSPKGTSTHSLDTMIYPEPKPFSRTRGTVFAPRRILGIPLEATMLDDLRVQP